MVLFLAIALGSPAHAQEDEAGQEDTPALKRAASLIEHMEQRYAQGKYAEAKTLAQEALEIRVKELGSEHPDVAEALNNLAVVHKTQGNYGAAEPLFRRALAIREKALGFEHPDVAQSLNNLAALQEDQGNYRAAKPLYRRALAIWEKALGPEHLEVARSLNNLAGVHLTQGNYGAAKPLYRRALTLGENALGPEHPGVAQLLNNLATLHLEKGDYGAAEPLLRRALAIRETALGPRHPHVAESLHNLAALYLEEGNYGAAEPLLRRALVIEVKALGPEHPGVAQSLNSLALLQVEQGDYGAAEPLYRRALAIREKALGFEHPDVAQSLNNLALLYLEQGDYRAAEPLLRRALAIREKALGPEHPDVALLLDNLAVLHHEQGNDGAAEPLHRRALAIRKEALGPEHPHIAESLNNLARLYWTRGEIARAVSLSERAEQAREAHLGLVIGSKSEHARRAFLDMLAGEVDMSLTLALETGATAAQRLASTLLLRRKGRVLDSLAGNLGALRSRLEPATQELFDEYRSVTTEYATGSLRGPGRTPIAQHRKRLDALAQRRRALERELAARSQAFRTQHAPITVQAIQDALPTGAALVEWARYRPFDPKDDLITVERHSPARYAACLLHAQGTPACIDLGEAAAIEAEVDAWRRAIAMRAADATRRGRALEARIMAPVRALLGNAEHLFLAPDGDLSLISMGALVDDEGRYLIERYRITYLTSGRDLLRPETPAPARQGAVVVASPSFDAGQPQPQVAGWPPASRASDLLGLRMDPLPATAQEAEALRARLARVDVWTGDQATEARLKTDVHGPVLVHIATHGVWLQDEQSRSGPGSREGFVITKAKPLALIPDPMLRSGLALAGFNQRAHGTDDGFLTALEAASLDLFGTQLVVLSACDTGLGEIASGQGVYGLRRALVLAGAQTLVMSLWKVDDATTRDLMLAYYDRLLAGEGRSEAMRQAQLALLRASETAHPYFWAAFIVSGDAAPMTGLVPRPRAAGCSTLIASRITNRAGLGMLAGGVLCALLTAAALLAPRRRRGQSTA